MQKFNDPCIKTGEFARLCGTNKRTLIHYDEIGLFKPAYTDDRGYRYYSESQFDVFFTINCLSKLGMPLREIGAFLNHRNPQALKKLLLEQREEVLKEEERIRKTRQVIETKLALVSLQEKVESLPDSDPALKDTMKHSSPVFQAGSNHGYIFQEHTPEEYLILSDPLNTNDHEAIIHTICSHIGYCNKNNLNAGHPYGAILDVSELRQGHLDTYAYFFTKVIDRPEDFPFHTKPAGTYAVAYLKGDYYDSERTYRQLFQWIDENGFHTGQYSYKEAVIDELAAASSEEYLTKISVQIF